MMQDVIAPDHVEVTTGQVCGFCGGTDELGAVVDAAETRTVLRDFDRFRRNVKSRHFGAEPCKENAVLAFTTAQIENRLPFQVAQEPATVLLREKTTRQAVPRHDSRV